MGTDYQREKIENWVGDFCSSDEMRAFSGGFQDVAGEVLVTFLVGACAGRGVEVEEIEEGDVRAALLGPVAKLALPVEVRQEVPKGCAALLSYLQNGGRLSGGRMLGAFVNALMPAFLEASAGKVKPIVRAGSKIGRNDPCPCGSGKKYKKCCANE